MSNLSNPNKKPTRAQELFMAAPDELKNLIRVILEEERRVMHKQRRSNIHQVIYDNVKRQIK